MISKRVPELRETAVRSYGGIDLKTYEYRLFRGQAINERKTEKHQRIIYQNKFIYGFNIEKHDELYLQEDGEFWCSKINQSTLGIRADVNGYRKKKRDNGYAKIMLFEGDMVRLHSPVWYMNGFTGIIELVNGIFYVKSVSVRIKLKDMQTTEFWEVIGNTAGVKDRSNALIVLED